MNTTAHAFGDQHAAAGESSIRIAVRASSLSHPERHLRSCPASIPSDEAYFWSAPWQKDVATALAELRNGESRVFTRSRDAISWLLSADDDG